MRHSSFILFDPSLYKLVMTISQNSFPISAESATKEMNEGKNCGDPSS